MSDIDSIEAIASSGTLSGYPGLWIRLVSATLGTYTSTAAASATGQVAFSVPRPAGVYEVWTSPDGSTWTDTGEQYQVFASALAKQSFPDVYLAGGLHIDPRHPNYGAKFDGVTDDTTALQAALTAAGNAGGGVVEFPAGTTVVTSSLTKPPYVHIIGRHPYSTIIDYRGTGPAILNTSQWLHDALANFAITHANNTNTGTSFIDAQAGANSCIFHNLRGVANPASTANGFIVRGVNPNTSGVNNSQYNNIFDNIRTASTGALASGIALYLYGQDINNAYANGNLVRGGVLDGFTNCAQMDGDGNLFEKVGFNSASGAAVTVVGGAGCYENSFVGCYFDSSITGSKVVLNNTVATMRYLAGFFGCLGLYNAGQIILAGSNTAFISYGLFGRSGNFGGGAPTNLTGVDQQEVLPTSNVGVMSYKGGSDDIGGRIIASASGYSASVNAVGPAGSVAAAIQAVSTADFRIVSTANGSSFTKLMRLTQAAHPAYSESANMAQGVATMAAGTVTVANTSVTANSRIMLSRQTAGGTLGELSVTKTAGTGFTITSTSSTETSTVAYLILEPA